jgi:hypothetical protein
LQHFLFKERSLKIQSFSFQLKDFLMKRKRLYYFIHFYLKGHLTNKLLKKYPIALIFLVSYLPNITTIIGVHTKNSVIIIKKIIVSYFYILINNTENLSGFNFFGKTFSLCFLIIH